MAIHRMMSLLVLAFVTACSVGALETYSGAGEFQVVGPATGAACRGDGPKDDNESYYELYENVETIEMCKVLCQDDPDCAGIEYVGDVQGGRCEVWTREEGINAFRPKKGITCMTYSPVVFEPVDGGIHRACRGDNPYDLRYSYFTAHTQIPSLKACQSLCTNDDACRGIEYHAEHEGGRCELWTRPAGIGATQLAEGYVCMRRSSHQRRLMLV